MDVAFGNRNATMTRELLNWEGIRPGFPEPRQKRVPQRVYHAVLWKLQIAWLGHDAAPIIPALITFSVLTLKDRALRVLAGMIKGMRCKIDYQSSHQLIR